MSDQITVTNLEELLASRCLSRITIAFDHEPSQSSSAQVDQEADDGRIDDQEEANGRLAQLNAAKIALLLVKGIARRCDDAEGNADVASLQVKDFCLAFQDNNNALVCTGEDSGDTCDHRGPRTLLNVEIVPREKGDAAIESYGDDDGRTLRSPMRNAVKIIHAVFANGSDSQPLLAPAQAGAASVVGKEEDDVDVFERQPKNPKARTRDASSLFSTLVHGGDCPVSVCRLLSDMNACEGARQGEQEGKPVISFEDVVRDLEQMSNHPEVFLFDQSHEFYSATLTFGQRCYGRTKELAQLLAISTTLEQSASPFSHVAAEAVFVSGVAGSGKSHFVQSVVTFLTNFGWVVAKAKFQRAMAHGSREIVAALFERLVARLVAMKSGEDEADVDYGRRATMALSEALDPDSLTCLARFIPALRELIPDINRNASLLAEAEMSHWQLVFLLSELVGALLSLDRHILMCMDDLQWCDSTMLVLIKEIIMSVGQDQQGRPNFLFVGMYRDDEIDQSHSVAEQLTELKNSSVVDVTEIKLSSLSTEEISDMIMSETRLSRRLVWGLADVVQKQTSGHALFVVQLLNSLVRESSIVYSPRNHRFDWDESRIASLRTRDSVASLIVSSLSRTGPKELRNLRILSCLGIQSDLSLIKLVDTSSVVPPGGIESSLAGLLEGGILKMSDQCIAFSHDLIQQHLYENIPIEERQKIHLDLGVFLGSKTVLDASSEKLSIEGGLDSLHFSNGSTHSDHSVKELTLISIAADQINAAGPKFIRDGSKLTRFAGWFLHAGKEAAECSNFQAALFHYKNGIAFLTEGLWLGDSTDQLCRELHEGATSASFALGKSADVEIYARAIIKHVPFEDSLVAQAYRIRSLSQVGKYAESIATGLALLRLLSIDIPATPSPMTIMGAMAKTGKVTSQYTSNQIITNMKKTSTNARNRNILKIVDTVMVACYREASPYLPLVTCAMIDYSFQNGVCEESAATFAVYGGFKIFLGEEFEEGRRWGEMALKIMHTNSAFAPLVVYVWLLFWFIPHQEIADLLFKTYEAGMRVGDVDSAMRTLILSMRFSLFGGKNLSLLSQAYSKHLPLIAKYNKECWEYAWVDLLLVEGLTGVTCHTGSACEGMIQDEKILLAHCKHKMHDQGMEEIYTQRLFSAFWARDYSEANKWLELASAHPSSKVPKIQFIHRTFFSALLAFRRYRDGEGEEFLTKGQVMLEKMRLWSKNSKAIFENKRLLLEAEYYACLCDMVASKKCFELSANSARDHGLVHEQGLACELYGNILSSIGDPAASQWYHKAHTCYLQWGAVAKAEQLQKELHLDLTEPLNASSNSCLSTKKHGRDDGASS